MITGLHLRCRDDLVVAKAAARVPGELTSKLRAALAAAAAQSGFLSVLLGHLCLLPSLDKGHSCLLSGATMVKFLGLVVEMETFSRVATVLARQQETCVLKVDNLVHVGMHKSAPQMICDCVDGCDALFKGPVVANPSDGSSEVCVVHCPGACQGRSVRQRHWLLREMAVGGRQMLNWA